MKAIRGSVALLRQLHRDGVQTLFGNPGTVEEGLLDALHDVPEIRYVAGLQESVVLAMADGHARTTHRPAVAQVHAAVGLGNAMAMLYQAHRNHTPLLIFAGEAPSSHIAFDGFLGGDLARIAEPVTKWSARVTHEHQLLRMVRRALKIAATPPQGPVFLALPMEVLDSFIEDDLATTTFIDTETSFSHEFTARIAQELIEATAPIFLVGDGVALSHGQKALKALSEAVGARVFGVDFADLSASFRDPMFMGLLGHSFGHVTRQTTLGADLLIAVGTPIFPELFPSHEPYFQPGAKLFHVDFDAWEVGKNFPVEAGGVGNPRLFFEQVLAAFETRAENSTRERATARQKAVTAEKKAARVALQAKFDAERAQSPMMPSEMMGIVASEIPDGTLVYDESISSTDELLHFLQPHDPTSYFLGRGGCIGVGWPGAVGAALAHPDRQVLALSGDGSASYVLQVLWTAAKYQTNVVFVVCNNRSYRILKVNMLHYWAEQGLPIREFPPFDLTDPELDFSQIAHGFGVSGVQVETPEEFRQALQTAFSRNGPFLIDVLIEGSVDEEMQTIVRAHSGYA